MSLSRNLRKLISRVASAIIVTGIIVCASPIAAFAQPPDPCHSTPVSAEGS